MFKWLKKFKAKAKAPDQKPADLTFKSNQFCVEIRIDEKELELNTERYAELCRTVASINIALVEMREKNRILH